MGTTPDSSQAKDNLHWYQVDDPPLVLDGLYWHQRGAILRRLPNEFKLTERLDFLAWNLAGTMLRFQTDATTIKLDVEIWQRNSMYHMPATGNMGFDLYLGSGKNKIFCYTPKFNELNNAYQVTIWSSATPPQMREFTIHFPLYGGIKSFKIGFNASAKLLPPTPWPDQRPVVVYGTSIQQGGCASRPGMCNTNQISRMLNRPFLNYGFSGNALGEPEMAELQAEIEHPAMYILDYDANALVSGLRQTLSQFITILRTKHPDTPILLVSKLLYSNEFNPTAEIVQERQQLTEIHRQELKRRQASGDKNIYFLDGSTLYGDVASECTVDGCHATDLGFYQISRHMAPIIEQILSH